MINVTPINIKTWARLGQRGSFFSIAMPDIANDHDDLKLLTADLAILSGMDRFRTAHPDKFLNVGIAEQNMIGIAAGLAMDGDMVFATTYASFIAVRSLEHVRQHLAHLGLNIKIVGSAAGVVAAKSGVSHWATEDLAFTRALPNIMVFSPADSLEAIKTAQYAASNNIPMYIRLSGGLNCPIVYKEDYEFIPGKLVCIKKHSSGSSSKKIALIATGLMVSRALDAVEILEDNESFSASCSVFNMHTIKPIDKEGLSEIFSEYDLVVTIEEHNIIGGMGSAVAEYKATLNNTPRQVFIGFNDSFYPAGSQAYVLDEAGLSPEKIAKRIMDESND
ncbi:transketolase subunit B [Ruminococcaceae bacterium KH2T8]|nr:transketolase subunit B [Ruminococcaceae bacterium KH2T8]